VTAPETSTSHRRVLIIEDERVLARTLRDMLMAAGYEVDTREDGRLGFEAATAGAYDLILLDVMLPSMDGFEVAETLRRKGVATPILMLTARDDLDDKVSGLKSGADDYLTKPFEVDELMARIEALLRRTSPKAGGELRQFDFGGMRADFINNRLIRKDKTVDLPDQESRLLRYFAEHRGEVVSRETLLKEVWDYKAVPFTRTVDVHVSWLRQKIEADPKDPRFIVTVHGRGYRFEG
jgi:two-component system, OmpR family, alkaline phosphatase synthesis response regulator PhoP